MNEQFPTKIEVTSGEPDEAEFAPPPFAGDVVADSAEKERETTQFDLLESRGFYEKITPAEGKNVTKQRYMEGVNTIASLVEDEVRAGRNVMFISQNRGEESDDAFHHAFIEVADKRVKEGKTELSGYDKNVGDYYFMTTDGLGEEEFAGEFVAEHTAKAESGDTKVIIVTEKVRDEEGNVMLIDTLDRLQKVAPGLALYAEVIPIVGDSDVTQISAENINGESVGAPVYPINKIAE